MLKFEFKIIIHLKLETNNIVYDFSIYLTL